MDEISKLKHEIEGLRLQLASKEEVLERCLDEIDRLSKQLEDQERRMSSQHKDNTTVLKKQDGMAQHGFNPLKGYACDRKQEVKSNCKITMAAIVPPKR